MKLAVVGSRNFKDYELLKKELDNFHIDLIISGGASGADKLAEVYAYFKKINTKIFFLIGLKMEKLLALLEIL